jgi:hypothetical protein
MKTSKILSVCLTIVCVNFSTRSQGFVNLNFENATITPVVPNFIYASNSIPGWTAYLDGKSQDGIFYDGVSAGGAIICLEDTNVPNGIPFPIQGSYSVLLEGASGVFGNNPTTASIGQTGTIPVSAQSLTFWDSQNNGTLQVTFNGQPLTIMDISNALNYTVYGADISPFAGQTGQLLFTSPLQTAALLDNIQFSSVPVPEPSEFALAALGALFLGFRRWRNSAR